MDFQLYTIEGEKFTLQQVRERCASVRPEIVLRRLQAGKRTWEELMKSGAQAQKEARKRLSRSIS